MPVHSHGRFSVAVEFFVRAESTDDAERIVGEGMNNLPDEIEDFIVQQGAPDDA